MRDLLEWLEESAENLVGGDASASSTEASGSSEPHHLWTVHRASDGGVDSTPLQTHAHIFSRALALVCP